MNDQGKSQIQTLAAGLLGFVGIVGLGSLLILHHGGAAVKAPASAYAPVDADPGMPSPSRAARPVLAGVPLGASGSAVSSPAPLPMDDDRGGGAAAASAAKPAAPNTPAAAAAAKLVVSRHLDASASATSSASSAVSFAPKPSASPALAKKPFLSPKLDLSKNQGTVASTVHYGVSSRSELMGRAAGPVYNFSGKAAARRSGEIAADNAGPFAGDAMRQVDVAQKKIDESDASADDKATVDRGLEQVRKTAAAPPAAP